MATTLSRDELLDAIGNMTVLELSEFVKAFEDSLVEALTEELRVPVFANGLGRGCLPADHELAFSVLASDGSLDTSVTERSTLRAGLVCRAPWNSLA